MAFKRNFQKSQKNSTKSPFLYRVSCKSSNSLALVQKNKKMRLNKAHLFVFLYKCEAVGAFAGNAIYFWGLKKICLLSTENL